MAEKIFERSHRLAPYVQVKGRCAWTGGDTKKRRDHGVAEATGRSLDVERGWRVCFGPPGAEARVSTKEHYVHPQFDLDV